MPTLPRLSGRAVVKAFGRGGWELARQKGSHMILVKEGSWATLSVSDHRRSPPARTRVFDSEDCGAAG
jgi:predicted RNA binding protein YcfA (HicA-like mRNA interferase family)